MEKLTILYVDDQREVLNTLSKDLQLFDDLVNIEACESADEALELMNDIDDEGDYVAVIISDHIMPGKNGVEFLTEIQNDERFLCTQKMLLTGQATHQDTITAINNANIQKYLEKPWKSEDIQEDVKILLTQFIVQKGIDYEKYMSILHQPTLLNHLKRSC